MRKVHVTAIAALLLWSVAAIAQTLDYSQAKSRADESEGKLSASEMQRFVEAQGRLAGGAFSQCVSRTGTSPSNFTVVVEMGSDGHVKNSWLHGSSSFAQCFRERMAAEFSFHALSLPFFTAFEYTNAP